MNKIFVVACSPSTVQARDKYNFRKVIRHSVRPLPELVGHGPIQARRKQLSVGPASTCCEGAA